MSSSVSLRRLGALPRARSAAAALEFALLLPFMTTALLGTVDLSLAMITSRRLSVAAQAAAEIGTSVAVQLNSTNQLTVPQVVQATNAVFGVFPNWKGNPDGTTFSMSLTGVAFTAKVFGCQDGCTYNAGVVWSASNPHGFTELRPCGTLASVSNTAPISLTTLPAGTFGPTSMLVADIDYTYRPVFFGFVTGNIKMRRAAYVPPRIGNGISLVGTNGAGVKICP